MTEDFILDSGRSVCLCADGLPGHQVGVAVAVEGGEHFVLVVDEFLGDPRVRIWPGCPDVGHEQLGPLPEVWKSRTWLAPVRCGRPTTTGRPCRVVVATAGQPCGRHHPRTEEKTS